MLQTDSSGYRVATATKKYPIRRSTGDTVYKPVFVFRALFIFVVVTLLSLSSLLTIPQETLKTNRHIDKDKDSWGYRIFLQLKTY